MEQNEKKDLLTEKELRRLSRLELLELLVEAYQENESLKARVTELEAAVDSRQITIEESGSLAEAAVRLSGVFESAQDAVDRYLQNVLGQNPEAELALKKKELESQERADAMLREAAERCRVMEEEARKKADTYMKTVQEKLQKMIEANEYLKNTFTDREND